MPSLLSYYHQLFIINNIFWEAVFAKWVRTLKHDVRGSNPPSAAVAPLGKELNLIYLLFIRSALRGICKPCPGFLSHVLLCIYSFSVSILYAKRCISVFLYYDFMKIVK